MVEEVTAWQHRPLEPIYPVLYLDALQVKVRDQGTMRKILKTPRAVPSDEAAGMGGSAGKYSS